MGKEINKQLGWLEEECKKLCRREVTMKTVTLMNLKNKWQKEAEQSYIDKVSKGLKELWKSQGIHPNDALREEIEDILLYR